MERVENVSLAGSVCSVDAVNVVDVVGPLCALGRAERLERGPCQVEGDLIAKRAMVLKRRRCIGICYIIYSNSIKVIENEALIL